MEDNKFLDFNCSHLCCVMDYYSINITGSWDIQIISIVLSITISIAIITLLFKFRNDESKKFFSIYTTMMILVILTFILRVKKKYRKKKKFPQKKL